MKTSILIDTNILIDVWGPPDKMTPWSKSAIAACSRDGVLAINTIVWSEIAPLIISEQVLKDASDAIQLDRVTIPWEAAFLAGLTHAKYRRAGGNRERTLRDFLIGAHAFVAGHRLLTRDPKRYRAYFPDLEIIAPDTHP